MSTKKIAVKKSPETKEATLLEVAGKLHAALPELKDKLGEKKFEKRIKKASKLLVAGIGKTPAKKAVTKTRKVIPVAKKAAKAPAKKAAVAAAKSVKK